eukprot:GGOE01041208.1.p1 GENE.GGOE01041208.1~~GGOE01041208.1.p1  ORF type:complete len:428 (-),score=132.12 GGOE01041208.1:50-1180(-)
MFHARGLDVRGVRVSQNKRAVEIATKSEPNDADEVLVTLSAEVDVGRVSLMVNSTAPISHTSLHGVYQCPYPKVKGAVVLTHFEPAYARGAFACVDDFAARPRWALELQAPAAMNVMSNMPLAGSKDMGKGTKLHTFQESPPMPVYLLAFFATTAALQVLEQECSSVDGTLMPVRVHCLQGHPDGPTLLSATVRGVALFEEYFAAALGLPKLDVVLAPRMMLGGMENWGLVFLNENDAKAQGKGKKGAEKLLNLLMHELAHQWMGNMVGLPFWVKEGICCHLEEVMGDVVNGRAPRASSGSSKVVGCKADDASKVSASGEASVLFTGTTYQRSQAFITDQVRRLGDDRFRDRLRELVSNYAHQYVTEQCFLDLLGT